MEKYEFILKTRFSRFDSYIVYYYGLFLKKEFCWVKKKFDERIENFKKNHVDCILLINKVDCNGEFLEIVQ